MHSYNKHTVLVENYVLKIVQTQLYSVYIYLVVCGCNCQLTTFILHQPNIARAKKGRPSQRELLLELIKTTKCLNNVISYLSSGFKVRNIFIAAHAVPVEDMIHIPSSIVPQR